MSKMSLEWVQWNRRLTDEADYGPIWWKNTSSFEEDHQKANGNAQAMLENMVGSRRDYTVLSDHETKKAVCDHYHRYLARAKVDVGAMVRICGEAEVIPTALKVETPDGYISTDLLRKFCYLEIIQKYLNTKSNRLTFLEIGPGIGSLARVIRSHYQRGVYIICDLPESLFYSHTFLNEAFPGAVHLVDEQNIDRIFTDPPSETCFLLVPTRLSEKIPDIRIDLLLNTASLGEMTNDACRRWFQFVNSRNIGSVFLFNRYLNNWHLSHKRGNFSSVLLEPDWQILEWELDPAFLKSPFEEMEPNYLLLFAERGRKSDQDELVRKANCHITRAEKSYMVQKHLTTPDAMKGRVHRPLYLGFEGPIFDYWQACRLNPTPHTLMQYIRFLRAWAPDDRPFEELFSYYYFLFCHDETMLARLHEAGRLWLFGAGEYGKLMLDILLEQGRAVAGVCDSQRTGTWHDHELISPEELKNAVGPNDIVLIASSAWKEISQSLLAAGITAKICSFGELVSTDRPPTLEFLT